MSTRSEQPLGARSGGTIAVFDDMRHHGDGAQSALGAFATGFLAAPPPLLRGLAEPLDELLRELAVVCREPLYVPIESVRGALCVLVALVHLAQEEVAGNAQSLRQPPKAPKGWRPRPGLEVRDGRGLEPRLIGKLGLAQLQVLPLLPEPVSERAPVP